MVERRRLKTSKGDGGIYFSDAIKSYEAISTGCTVLNCVLGMGYPLGRMVNIVGDKAVGKTLLAIEACANFHHKYPKGHIWYREAEAAFDLDYAEQLGLPTKRVNFGPEGIDSIWDTVEDIFEDLEACIQIALKSKQPGIYIVDSLDALSSRAELDRKIDEGSYRMEKPRVMGELFRRTIRHLRKARITFVIVSQVRDNIGVMFGERHTRTGGKALDFYASQILWLSNLKTVTQTSGGVTRPTALRVRAKCKKNKVGPSFRECDFAIRFGFGIDDVEASVNWLKEHKLLDKIGKEESGIKSYLRQCAKMSGVDLREERASLDEIVRGAWAEVESRFRPAHKKYGD